VDVAILVEVALVAVVVEPVVVAVVDVL